MFTKSAAFYDLIDHWKDYRAEADKLVAFILIGCGWFVGVK